MSKMEKISIIGSGWVGTIVGKGFSKLGYEVIFHDIVDKNLPNFTKDFFTEDRIVINGELKKKYGVRE